MSTIQCELLYIVLPYNKSCIFETLIYNLFEYFNGVIYEQI